MNDIKKKKKEEFLWGFGYSSNIRKKRKHSI